MNVRVIGAGVAGLACALELAEAGVTVEVVDKSPRLGEGACSWFAGGMLAPWCESESAEPLITTMGAAALAWWKHRVPSLKTSGTLVVTQGRDAAEVGRFIRRTSNVRQLDANEIAELEPDLAERFQTGLFYEQEAHLDPRQAVHDLKAAAMALGVTFRFGEDGTALSANSDRTIDCRGLAARDTLTDLRGVKGEMLLVRTREIQLSRPVRLLHPRIPLYIVPRGDGLFMVGATMIESDDRRRISARSMIELLQSAYALHPAFAEAEVVEIGTDVRPAFPDNLPRIRERGTTVYVNGLYRHGFLLAPTLAQWTKNLLLQRTYYPEVMDEHSMQRQAHHDHRTKPSRSAP